MHAECQLCTLGNGRISMEKLKRPQSLFKMALEQIRTGIVDGDIELGAQISELGISQPLGISKTPVREALQELRREGLVQIDPQRGTSVFLPNEAELLRIFDFRALLEVGAARRMFTNNPQRSAQEMRTVIDSMKICVSNDDHHGYRRLDSKFHNVIIAGAENSYISEAYEPVSIKIDALRSRGLGTKHVMERSLAFHEKLFQLLEASC